jgi:hypothetical protein
MQNSNRWQKVTAISTAISTALAACAAWAALTFAYRQIQEGKQALERQIKESREQAKIQRLVEIEYRFEHSPMIDIRRKLAAERIDKRHQRLFHLDTDNPPAAMYDALDFCEDVGQLTQRGYLDSHDVWSVLGYWLLVMYTDARPLVDAERKHSPASYANCVRLMDNIRPIEMKEDAGAFEHPSESNIYNFYSYEGDAKAGEPARKHGNKSNQ